MEYDVEEEDTHGFKGFPEVIDCFKVEDFKLEVDENQELILPDGPPGINWDNTDANGPDEMILPNCDESSNSSNNPVKYEPVEIKDESDELETEHDEFIVVLPLEDDSSDDSQKVVESRRNSVEKRKGPKEWCDCNQQCGNLFSEKAIAQIQNSLMDKSVKELNDMLSRYVQLSIDESNQYKNAIFRTRFFLPYKSKAKEVCRKMFQHTFQLTTRQVNSLLNFLPEKPNVKVAVKDSYKLAVSDAVPRTDVVLCPQELDGPDEVKQERLDEPESRQNEFVGDEVEEQDDNSDTDSQSEIIPSAIHKSASSILNIRKECKTRGLSYTSHSGRLIPARAVKPNCGASCKIQCRTRVSDEVRPQLLANLLQMSLNDQRKFFNDHVCCMPAANPRSLSGRRTVTSHYFLPVDSRLVKVCRTMFINTYDITKKILLKNLAKKVGDKHVVCGNPNFPRLLKKGNKYYFDYDEGCDQASAGSHEVREEGCECDLQCGSTFSEAVIAHIQSNYRKKTIKGQNKFLSEHVQLSAKRRKRYKSPLYRARFFLPLGSTVKEVCRKVFARTFKLSTSQVATLLKNLPENPNLPVEAVDPLELAKKRIVALRMEEDHHCAVSGGLWKLSHCPNVARVYSEYLEGCGEGVEPIDYRQFYAEFSKTFAKTGLLLPTRCPDCGFFDRE